MENRIEEEELYIYEKSPKPIYTDVIGFEIPIPLPVRPSVKKMKNYGLPKKEQKFKREDIPKDLALWPKRMIDDYVAKMWHKRKNGEWWIIGGQEIYLTGKAWTFFNFWVTEKGTLPDFRMEAVEFFLVWDYCLNDSNCFGFIDIKPRRIGDTEKTLFIMWEHCSRVRYQRGGMQNVKDDAAEKNFKRLVRGHNKMVWFFKPMMKGSDSPSQVLEFTYPEQKMTRKKIKEQAKKGSNASAKLLDNNYKFSPIDSSIDYEASVQGRYDGERLGIYHLDEPGKIMAFNIREQWPVIRRTLTLHNDRLIVGKSIWTTTVEDYKKGKKSGESMSTMMNIEYFWKNSNPNKRDGNGRTITGLYRYFRSCVLSDEPDEYGFYNEEKTIETVMNTRNALEEISDWDQLAQFKRQYPLNIQDVFTLPLDECVLMPVLLDRRSQQLDDGLTWDNKMLESGPIKPMEIRGDLIWSGGNFGDQVEFYPNPVGRWYISQFPIRRNAKIEMRGVVKPANDSIYSFGVDPYDHMIEGKTGEDGSPIHSDGAGVVYRKYDDNVDGHLERDDENEIKDSEVHKMQTDTFVCVYVNRPQDPYEYYEDMLKTAVYYGVPMFFEKDKPGVGNFFRSSKSINGHSFSSYLKDRPKETRTEFGSRKLEKGAKASAPVIQLYVDALKWHVIHRIHNYHHPLILKDFRKFKIHNRTECDLTVAAGYALLAAGTIMKKRIDERKEEMNKSISYFRKYKRNR